MGAFKIYLVLGVTIALISTTFGENKGGYGGSKILEATGTSGGKSSQTQGGGSAGGLVPPITGALGKGSSGGSEGGSGGSQVGKVAEKGSGSGGSHGSSPGVAASTPLGGKKEHAHGGYGH